jgi:hypothetical protein
MRLLRAWLAVRCPSSTASSRICARIRSRIWIERDGVAAVDGQAAGALERALEFDYARPAEKPDCRWRERSTRERMLTRVAQDAERALRAVEHAEGLLDDERVADAHRLLRELVGQDFDIDDDGVPRLHRGTRADRIVSGRRSRDASWPQERKPAL